MRRIGLFIAGVMLMGYLYTTATASRPSPPVTQPPAMGTPFSVDGWQITLMSLQPVSAVQPGIQPMAGTEMWVLDIKAVNQTGGEASAGSGFRLVDDAGVIANANFISLVQPELSAQLVNGGTTRGYLTFSVPVLRRVVAILVKPGGDQVSVPLASAPPPTPIAAAASPTLSAVTLPTPSPSVAPTSTPKPTLRPAVLAFGTLHYETNACWDSTLSDLAGHASGGIQVKFSLMVKNGGQVKGVPFTITTQSTDWFETTPWSYPDSWKLSEAHFPDAKTAELGGPAIGPAKSTTLKWTTSFITPFDPHYTVVIDGPGVTRTQTWEMWTNSTFC